MLIGYLLHQRLVEEKLYGSEQNGIMFLVLAVRVNVDLSQPNSNMNYGIADLRLPRNGEAWYRLGTCVRLIFWSPSDDIL